MPSQSPGAGWSRGPSFFLAADEVRRGRKCGACNEAHVSIFPTPASGSIKHRDIDPQPAPANYPPFFGLPQPNSSLARPENISRCGYSDRRACALVLPSLMRD